MKIIIDAMGGDNAPEEIVKGALNCVKELNCEIILVGRGEEILRIIERSGLGQLPKGLEIVDATEIIEIEDDPASVIRTKKNSSLVVALNLLRDGRGDALVSAGSTGALLSGATLIVKRIRGIRRAALAPFIPNSGNGFILIDCGANAECTPEYLLQFAHMGYCYAQDALSLASPRVGLLNIGGESTKGTPLQIDTYAHLETAGKNGLINFAGNIEPTAAMKDACDVLVTDGYTGNIFLKTIEGTAKLVMSELKTAYLKSFITMISAMMVKKQIRALRQKMSADTIGGTALLGISKPVIKAHGSSNATAIVSAARQAIKAAESDTTSRLTASLSINNANNITKTVDKS